MTSYRYRALTESGVVLSGEIDAPSEHEAVEMIRAQGHYPISADAAGRESLRNLPFRDIRFARAPRQKDLALATRELSTLLEAGLELDRALETLAALGEMDRLRGTLTSIVARIRGGFSFADALAAEGLFPAFYVSLVRAGESGGSLAPTLERLGSWLERTEAVRQAVASALVYPVILLLTTGLSVLLILVFVLPEFEPLFLQAGQELPLATRVVMGAGHIAGAYWWAVLLISAGAALSFRLAKRRPEFALRWDRWKLRLPLVGDLLLKTELERFSRTLGMLLQNGVALPQALSITRDTLNNKEVAGAVEEALTHVRRGDTLSARLAQTRVFPPVAVDLIRIGEQTGRLDELLLRQAEMHERSLRQTIDRVLALLVPVLTLFLGMIVAGVIASILVAILSVNELAI